MVGFKQTLCALLLMAFAGVTVAQNNTNSPYTRYGYGDLVNQNFGNSKAMGGIAFGLRDGSQINPLNPASYTAIDSLTFLFEGGASLQNSNISDGSVKLNVKNSSFDYIAMQFRLHRRVAMSIGLLPFRMWDTMCRNRIRKHLPALLIQNNCLVTAVCINYMSDWV